jgi:hypothetical protein
MHEDNSVNTEKTKYMLLSRHQNAGQNLDVKIGNRWFENVAQFRYLGTTITNQNLIQQEIKGVGEQDIEKDIWTEEG